MVISVMSACEDNEVEEKFDKPYTERVAAQIIELRTSLMASEHGWKTLYITDNENLGGFNFLFKFTGENTVEMASDFSPEDTVFRSSEYAIKDASTVKLSFTTGNAIHKLSDSNNSPISGEEGSGYKGDLEFLYYGKDGEDLIFRGNRTNGSPSDHVEIRFVKAESSELDNIQTAFKNRIQLGSILAGDGTSVYRTLSVVQNGEETKFSYNYSNVLTFLNVNAMDDAESFSSPVYFTKEGFVISNIEVGTEKFADVEFSLSSYDASNDQFTTSIENGTVTLGSGAGPLIPVNGHKEIINPRVVRRMVYFHRDRDLPSGLTTESFEALYDEAGFATFQFYNDFVFQSGNIADLFWLGLPTGLVVYTYDDRDDRIVFATSSRPDALTNEQNAFLDFLFDDEGFYVENLGAVTRFSNHVYTFTSVKDPSIRVAFYKFS